jgi:hypothetical protein
MSFYLYCIKCHKKFHSSSHCFLHWKFETTAFITPTPTPVPTPTPKTKSQAQTTQVLYYNLSKPNAKETRQSPEGNVKTTLGGFKGCMGFELREAGHKGKVYALMA